MADIIKMLEEEEIARLGKDIPLFHQATQSLLVLTLLRAHVNVYRLSKVLLFHAVTVVLTHHSSCVKSLQVKVLSVHSNCTHL